MESARGQDIGLLTLHFHNQECAGPTEVLSKHSFNGIFLETIMLHPSLRFEVCVPFIRYHRNHLNFFTGDKLRNFYVVSIKFRQIYWQFLQGHKWVEGDNSEPAL